MKTWSVAGIRKLQLLVGDRENDVDLPIDSVKLMLVLLCDSEPGIVFMCWIFHRDVLMPYTERVTPEKHKFYGIDDQVLNDEDWKFSYIVKSSTFLCIEYWPATCSADGDVQRSSVNYCVCTDHHCSGYFSVQLIDSTLFLSLYLMVVTASSTNRVAKLFRLSSLGRPGVILSAMIIKVCMRGTPAHFSMVKACFIMIFFTWKTAPCHILSMKVFLWVYILSMKVFLWVSEIVYFSQCILIFFKQLMVDGSNLITSSKEDHQFGIIEVIDTQNRDSAAIEDYLYKQDSYWEGWLIVALANDISWIAVDITFKVFTKGSTCLANVQQCWYIVADVSRWCIDPGKYIGSCNFVKAFSAWLFDMGFWQHSSWTSESQVMFPLWLAKHIRYMDYSAADDHWEESWPTLILLFPPMCTSICLKVHINHLVEVVMRRIQELFPRGAGLMDISSFMKIWSTYRLDTEMIIWFSQLLTTTDCDFQLGQFFFARITSCSRVILRLTPIAIHIEIAEAFRDIQMLVLTHRDGKHWDEEKTLGHKIMSIRIIQIVVVLACSQAVESSNVTEQYKGELSYSGKLGIYERHFYIRRSWSLHQVQYSSSLVTRTRVLFLRVVAWGTLSIFWYLSVGLCMVKDRITGGTMVIKDEYAGQKVILLGGYRRCSKVQQLRQDDLIGQGSSNLIKAKEVIIQGDAVVGAILSDE